MKAPDHSEDANLSRLHALADECVMCGLCLPHCPTFNLTGLETQSPRGRIALARQLQQGVAADAAVTAAFDSCLQCRACEVVCPAQVRYGEIIERARAAVTPTQARDWWQLGLKQPQVLARALGMAGTLARVWPGLTRRLGRRARWLLRARQPLPPVITPIAQTVLFAGCVARSFEREAQESLLLVAATLGLGLELIEGQGCCGALARHQGDLDQSDRQRAQHQALWSRSGVRTVVALDSGCISSLKPAEIASFKVFEACRWLLEQPQPWPLHAPSRRLRIGWFAPCTHRNVLRDANAARELLALLQNVEILPIPLAMGCCGAAGPHVLTHPDSADALARPMADAIAELQLDALASTNVGCSLHLSERLMLRGITLPVRHPVAFLADQLSHGPK